MNNIFSLNHMTTANIGYGKLLSLASSLGCVGVELRNDLPGELFNGEPLDNVRHLAEKLNLRVLSFSEIRMFNSWSDERAIEASAVIKIAKAIGAEAVSLIPRCDGKVVSLSERQRDLQVALRELLPMLNEAGLIALVEPVGFEHSSLRFKEEAIDAINTVGGRGVYRLIHDTFHHHISGESTFFADDTGIVHVSGVIDPSVPTNELRDSHRILVDEADRLGNIAQLHELRRAGYAGPISYEAFSPIVHRDENPEVSLQKSMQYILDALTPTTLRK